MASISDQFYQIILAILNWVFAHTNGAMSYLAPLAGIIAGGLSAWAYMKYQQIQKDIANAATAQGQAVDQGNVPSNTQDVSNGADPAANSIDVIHGGVSVTKELREEPVKKA